MTRNDETISDSSDMIKLHDTQKYENDGKIVHAKINYCQTKSKTLNQDNQC